MTEPKTLREQRQEKRTKEILVAALELFDQKGYQGASMEEIAKASLLTRAGLYKYFSDKASLLAALRRWKIDQLTERILNTIDKAQGFEAEVKAIIYEMLSFQEENPGFFRILFTAGTLPELKNNGAFDAFGQLLTAVVAKAMQTGEAESVAAADETMMMLVSLIFKNSIKRNVLGYEPSTNLEHDAALMARIFLNGVSKR